MSDEAGDKEQEQPEKGFGELSSLRRILVGPLEEELEEIGELARQGLAPKAVSEVLPEAVLIRQRKDERLAEALAPTMERALHRSVKRNPQNLADALFPVMGPAIRRSIQHTLSTMLEGMNRTFEYGLTAKGLKWRLEAWRTGRSFGEVILLKSLVYRVEQALLIHRKTGLLLEHAEHLGVGVTDPEMVSAMLTAIQSFVGDSFAKGSVPSISQVEFGEGVLEIATGPHAALAVLVRGTAPGGLRTKLEEAVEHVHKDFWEELAEFDGDPAPFFATRETLENCLGEQRVAKDEENKPKKKITPAHLFLVIVGLALMTWAVFAWKARSKWNAAMERINDEPGLILLRSERRSGDDLVEGLRDPNAPDPARLLREMGIDPDDCQLRFHPMRSLEPELIGAHAREVLKPPAGVHLQVEPGGRLSVIGDVTDEWLERARTAMLGVDGVTSVQRATNEEAQDR